MASLPDSSSNTTTLGIAVASDLTGHSLGQAVSTSGATVPDNIEKDNAGKPDDVAPQTNNISVSTAENDERIKMVIVVRSDLNMTAGKIAAQCGHATLAGYKAVMAQKDGPTIIEKWEREGQTKIVVSAKSEDKLLSLQKLAHSIGVAAECIVDAGRTQVDPNTMTVMAVGPGPVFQVDQVTKSLRLLP